MSQGGFLELPAGWNEAPFQGPLALGSQLWSERSGVKDAESLTRGSSILGASGVKLMEIKHILLQVIQKAEC